MALHGNMQIHLSQCTLRPWDLGDAESLAKNANDREVWLHLRDFFPHPYAVSDANNYLKYITQISPPTAFAITVDGEACGNVSASLQNDVHRLTAEIGYWLGRPYWGRGIMTEAVGAFTDYLFATFNLTRVFAVPYASNPASARTLEKNGFEFEGRMRKSVVKDGQILDQLLYAKTTPL